MAFLYNIGIQAYHLAIQLAAPFNEKAALLRKGRKEVWKKAAGIQRGEGRLVWFHAASLGEFEQGRPVIEALKAAEPATQILLTFFSPSGYEIRKNYTGADYILYLPGDTQRNAVRLIEKFRPDAAVFIKYEFWFHYLNELNKRNIPVYLISAIFRPNQPFFKSWGKLHRRMLGCFKELFVQDGQSVELLKSIGIKNVRLTGDTRFDRVLQIREEAKDLPLVKMFKGDNAFTFVAGSSWGPDEDLFLEYFNTHPEMKLIIAPHVIDENHLVEIISKLKRPYVRYTRADEKNVLKVDCLIIDCFGLLSSIYRYGEVAYIGGGFGVGIHNTLEAAVYGIPVIFGPKYQKFMEAIRLLEAKGAYSIKDYHELKTLLDRFQADDVFMRETGANAGYYVTSNAGATEKIMHMINF